MRKLIGLLCVAFALCLVQQWHAKRQVVIRAEQQAMDEDELSYRKDAAMRDGRFVGNKKPTEKVPTDSTGRRR